MEMATLTCKPNVREAICRLRSLYQREAPDRIFARTSVPSPTLERFQAEHADGFCDFPDLGERVAFWESLLAERAELEDDSVPAAYLTEMDQGLYGGLLGGEVRYQCDTQTGWISSMVVPLLKDWSEFDRLKFDPAHPWFERYLNELELFIKAADGKFGVSHFILINNLNFVYELLGATETYMSVEEHPEMVRKAIDLGFDLNASIHDAFFDRVSLIEGGTCSNKVQWLPGRVVSESIDPFHMTRVDYFERWGREPVERIFARYDGGILHIHGNGRHLLEAACSVKGLKAIEMGDDQGYPFSLEVVDELRRRAGNVPLTVRADYPTFVAKLDRRELPGGILYYVGNVPDADAANRLMEKVRKYRA